MDWDYRTGPSNSFFWVELYAPVIGNKALRVIRPSLNFAEDRGLDTDAFYVVSSRNLLYEICAGPFESAELAKLTLQLML